MRRRRGPSTAASPCAIAESCACRPGISDASGTRSSPAPVVRATSSRTIARSSATVRIATGLSSGGTCGRTLFVTRISVLTYARCSPGAVVSGGGHAATRRGSGTGIPCWRRTASIRCWARPRTVSPRRRRISDLGSTDAATDSLRTVAASIGSVRVAMWCMVMDGRRSREWESAFPPLTRSLTT